MILNPSFPLLLKICNIFHFPLFFHPLFKKIILNFLDKHDFYLKIIVENSHLGPINTGIRCSYNPGSKKDINSVLQVIPLRDSKDSSGCTVWNETGEAFYVCVGERVFRSSVARTWFFAISRCGQSGPLNLNYVFNITGQTRCWLFFCVFFFVNENVICICKNSAFAIV